MPVRFALFDMDDVLCRYDVEARVAFLARHAGRTVEEVHRDLWESGFLDESDRGRWNAAAYLAEFGRRLGRAIDRVTWIEARRLAMHPFSDVLALVQRLSLHVPVAVLTNNDPLVGESIDALFPQLRPLFGERILVSSNLASAKPDPACFLDACYRLGFVPAETFFTDDRPENVEGARAAGLTGHVFRDLASLKAALRLGGLP